MTAQTENNIFQQDKVAHFSCGYLISSYTNIQTYELLSFTQMNTKTAKAVSLITGVGMGVLAGHLKETYDRRHGGTYNMADLRATIYGSIAGSITIRLILWNSFPRSKLPDDVFINY